MLAVLVVGFQPPARHAGPACSSGRLSSSHVRMGLFDGLAKAFENDDTLGERAEAGLREKAEFHTITWQGPAEQTMFGERPGPQILSKAVAGQKLKDIAQASGVEIPYSCNEGTCRICDVKVNGRLAPACVAKMPKKDVTIEFYPNGVPTSERQAARGGGVQGTVVPTGEPAVDPAMQRKQSLEERLRAEMEAEAAEKAAQKKPAFPAFGMPSFANPFDSGEKTDLEALRQKAMFKNKQQD